ncbi:MAG TPA: DUF4912 domain-containing protein [Pirellulales bacterium]|nr:DUF4912 domain-containing protein [Pirellulales bacterium]
MAKKRGVRGWHSMRKDQLVKVLTRLARTVSKGRTQAAVPATRKSNVTVLNAKGLSAKLSGGKPMNGKAAGGVAKATIAKAAMAKAAAPKNAPARLRKPQPRPVAKPKDPAIVKRLQDAKEKQNRWKSLAFEATNGKQSRQVKDRLVAMVRDSFWLHAYWELTRTGVERAEAAMGKDWHGAKPVLRIFEVSGGGSTTAAERLWRTIEIHGGVNNWYIDVVDPPKSYRLDIGYLSADGKFFVLCRSNVVTTPVPGTSDAIDGNWAAVAEDFEKVYALSGGYSAEGPNLELQQLFEERLRRPMGSPMATRFGPGAEALAGKKRDFHFELDAELIVFGATEPDAHVTLQGDPVRLRPDGTFTVRFSLPNCRQVIPAVASSANGLEQRTVVLAVERNTKAMEPLVRDAND